MGSGGMQLDGAGRLRWRKARGALQNDLQLTLQRAMIPTRQTLQLFQGVRIDVSNVD